MIFELRINIFDDSNIIWSLYCDRYVYAPDIHKMNTIISDHCKCLSITTLSLGLDYGICRVIIIFSSA